jgi:hypothetical protein
MKKALLLMAVVSLLTACVSVTQNSVKEMPTGYLCSLLNQDAYITLGSERRIIFAELRERGEDCVLPQGTSKPTSY